MGTITARPTRNDDAVTLAALESLLPDIKLWLEQGGDKFDRDEVIQDLRKATGWRSDGYEIAKELENRCYWSPDAELVKILDGFSTHSALEKAEAAWVAAQNVQPPFAVGARVAFKHGRQSMVGRIEEIDAKHGKFIIAGDGMKTNSRAVVRYEDCTAETPTPVTSHA